MIARTGNGNERVNTNRNTEERGGRKIERVKKR